MLLIIHHIVWFRNRKKPCQFLQFSFFRSGRFLGHWITDNEYWNFIWRMKKIIIEIKKSVWTQTYTGTIWGDKIHALQILHTRYFRVFSLMLMLCRCRYQCQYLVSDYSHAFLYLRINWKVLWTTWLQTRDCRI